MKQHKKKSWIAMQVGVLLERRARTLQRDLRRAKNECLKGEVRIECMNILCKLLFIIVFLVDCPV